MRNPTAGDLRPLVVPEITSRSTLFAGSNTGISFCVLGPSCCDGMLGTVFFISFVGRVVIGCVVFTVVLRLMFVVALPSAMMMPVDAVDGCVGVISVDLPGLAAFTKVNLGNKCVKN